MRRNSWLAQKLIVNFNQKQWRQDLAAYIREHLFWRYATVTRSKFISNNIFAKKIKEFKIFDGYGNVINVQYKNFNEIIFCSNDVVKKYLEERKF